MRDNAREFALWSVGGAVMYTLRGNGLLVAVSVGIAAGLGAWYLTDKTFNAFGGSNGS